MVAGNYGEASVERACEVSTPEDALLASLMSSVDNLMRFLSEPAQTLALRRGLSPRRAAWSSGVSKEYTSAALEQSALP
jgi:hypothetical protein